MRWPTLAWTISTGGGVSWWSGGRETVSPACRCLGTWEKGSRTTCATADRQRRGPHGVRRGAGAAPGVELRGVTTVVAAAGRRAGLGTIGAHRLRHSAATAMLAGGGSLREIGDVLRQRRAMTTAIYAKVDLNALRTPGPPLARRGQMTTQPPLRDCPGGLPEAAPGAGVQAEQRRPAVRAVRRLPRRTRCRDHQHRRRPGVGVPARRGVDPLAGHPAACGARLRRLPARHRRLCDGATGRD